MIAQCGNCYYGGSLCPVTANLPRAVPTLSSSLLLIHPSQILATAPFPPSTTQMPRLPSEGLQAILIAYLDLIVNVFYLRWKLCYYYLDRDCVTAWNSFHQGKWNVVYLHRAPLTYPSQILPVFPDHAKLLLFSDSSILK